MQASADASVPRCKRPPIQTPSLPHLYRRHFVLFVGIAALPHLVLLAVQLASTFLGPGATMRPQTPAELFSFLGSQVLWLIPVLIVALIVNTTVQAATVVSVSHLYLD